MNMQSNDDEKFEKFLRQFQPRAPEPLRIDQQEPARMRPFMFAAWAAAAAVSVVVIAVTFITWRGSKQAGPQDVTRNAAGVELTSQQPLTISSANALLAQAPSVKAAVDQMALHPQSTQLPKGKYSALAVLSEEKIKL